MHKRQKEHYVITHQRGAVFKMSVIRHDPSQISEARVSIRFPLSGKVSGKAAGFGSDYLRAAFDEALERMPKIVAVLYESNLKQYENLKERSARISADTSKTQRYYERTLTQLGSEREAVDLMKKALKTPHSVKDGNGFPFKELLEAAGFTVTLFSNRR